ncbi:hypothetical protein HGP14_27855 [Rhizobium sp. P32RR-XVIII]|uniref:hypothetical protein n=1 Tax=Rhizobium sp. P32RR-XVIII TaxID=2726738 RepID=UPI0014575AA7|nr:hypothetical protein [Rhizobium sp. P32RR-XVIII]NLS07118.1 hypothetical protein [Rhizobium sp. P32RR-XVIII]
MKRMEKGTSPLYLDKPRIWTEIISAQRATRPFAPSRIRLPSGAPYSREPV